MSVVQPCARCGARWAVQSTPMHWCPRCRGVLLSPAPIDAPPERRNYRWIARRPDHRPRRPAGGRSGTQAGTPKYTHIPRWGLIDPPPRTADAPRTRWQRWTERVEPLLLVTAGLFALASAAELGRYGILLRNRTRLIEPLLLRASDALVIGSAVLASVFALLTAVALIGWLIETRAATFASAGRSDPRSARTLTLGCVIPGVNLLWPGVFLTELARQRDDPRTLRAIRVWWCAWILGGAMAAAALLWRTADSLQAQADGVLFMVWTDLVAAGVAVLTLWVVRLFAGRDLLGRTKLARRWVVAADAAVPVIEPVHPGAGQAKVEDQEVMAK
ncbi:DUF4328 domain-containing protein [Nocardia goodfellowii]|uniref:DUF4328 domain-containing protein n=1 Tax=Nocardia goodfellowii TaxID=882446 RepID=A0ABS4QAN7_9NOCA|nr:DUF4328 domain-containing protein [Nocardia goodfellowii]MBP2188153.1 hypothetical protein [Nocardia goodfellowii]